MIAAENKLNEIYGGKERVSLDHQLTISLFFFFFYSQEFFNHFVFEVTLAPASQMVRGQHTALVRNDLQPNTCRRGAQYVHMRQGVPRVSDHVFCHKVVPFKKGTDTRLNMKEGQWKRSCFCL